MALFGGLFKSAKTADDAREHERAPGHGARVTIDRKSYVVDNLSASGFRIQPYDGDLIPRQQFSFRFHLVLNGESYEFPARGLVVRIDDAGLAAKYQKPQPYYRHILDEYLRASTQQG